VYYYTDRKIDKAFRLLEEAAKSKQEEMNNFRPQFSPMMVNLASNAINQMKNSVLRIESVFEDGQRISKMVLQKAQEEIEKNPWTFLGKVAVVGFGVGLILGFHYKDFQGGNKK
jgi:ElaB/YqjD/DUF883 family membrane-anchored ribosome-binding protein